MHELDEWIRQNIDDSVEHSGVKGMKWGVRRSDDDNKDSNDNASGGGGGDGPDDEELMQKLMEMFGIDFGNIDDKLKKMGSDIFTSIFGQGKPKWSVIDLNKAKRIGDLKMDNNSVFKNPQFQKEWARREAERAKINKLVNDGSISSKDAKALYKKIDKDTEGRLKRAEKNKNVKRTITTDIKPVTNDVSGSKKSSNKNEKYPKTIVSGSKEEKDFYKRLEKDGWKKVKQMTPKERKQWMKSKNITVTTTDMTINGKPVKGSPSYDDLIEKAKKRGAKRVQ